MERREFEKEQADNRMGVGQIENNGSISVAKMLQ